MGVKGRERAKSREKKNYPRTLSLTMPPYTRDLIFTLRYKEAFCRTVRM